MQKGFQRLGLKLQLMGFGASAFFLPWVGVQHLETNRAALSQEKQAALDKEFQLQQQVESLNQQVKTTQQQLSQKESSLKATQQQLTNTSQGQAPRTQASQTSVATRQTPAVTPAPAPARKVNARAKAS